MAELERLQNERLQILERLAEIDGEIQKVKRELNKELIILASEFNLDKMTIELFIPRYITPEFLRNLSKRSYGKFMGEVVDKDFIKDLIEHKTKCRVIKVKRQDKNEGGFDVTLENGTRIQVKFRQWNGKNAYSQQAHFENTRRKSKKNSGEASESGHVVYKTNEFDCCLIILCPSKPAERDPKYWEYSCVESALLANPNNPELCVSKITSDNLERGKDWIKILEALDAKKGGQ